MKGSLAILGTGSDVGKSLTVTALCRIFANMGINVAPFKAQNMSNNSYSILDGLEIARAQVVQAQAAKIKPEVNMNPVLIKPSTNEKAQVILNGKILQNRSATEYFKNTQFLFKKACKSYKKLKQKYDFIIIEGAGSCAEMNLYDQDFVNLRMAEFSKSPVILVGDIDRGGIFAQIIGTINLLPQKHKKLIKGFIINKFRGDMELFKNGIKFIEKKTKLPVLGVIPYFKDIEIDSEDGFSPNITINSPFISKDHINIAVIRLPHISNFTDVFPVMREPCVNLTFITHPDNILSYDCIIIPGSKNVIEDVKWLKTTNFYEKLQKFNGIIFGICGGYQMLGKAIYDPFNMESDTQYIEGLKLLDIKTTLQKEKKVSISKGYLIENKIPVNGYEIHIGETVLSKNTVPFAIINSQNNKKVILSDGAISKNRKIFGTYLHGIFDDFKFRHYFLKLISPNKCKNLLKLNESEYRNIQYNKLAKLYEKNLDMEKLKKIINLK